MGCGGRRRAHAAEPPEVPRSPYKLLVYPTAAAPRRSSRGLQLCVHLFASHGYAVFQANFRGSQGYGRQFLDADRRDLGGGDMRDILTGVDGNWCAKGGSIRSGNSCTASVTAGS